MNAGQDIPVNHGIQGNALLLTLQALGGKDHIQHPVAGVHEGLLNGDGLLHVIKNLRTLRRVILIF